ncbi:hypothetical protein Metli_0824 [Methanofollis liminatans DSM 4140]|uniref:Uncharacterized protein n=1 Tax=Methanofollis liminatans DSM 4140 TaxID=28892 RepID=J0S878_9EURY|nr:hypothetical protein Metli_0824 [Methanofollis liminatans DSM 4140]
MGKMSFVTLENIWMKDGRHALIEEIMNSDRFWPRPYWDADLGCQISLAYFRVC